MGVENQASDYDKKYVKDNNFKELCLALVEDILKNKLLAKWH